MSDGFWLIWTQGNGEPLDADEFLPKLTFDAAFRAAGRRCHQSQHLNPANANGFFVLADREWRIYRGINPKPFQPGEDIQAYIDALPESPIDFDAND